MHVCMLNIATIALLAFGCGAYMSAMHDGFYVIDLAYTHMHICERNEKRIVSNTWCTLV